MACLFFIGTFILICVMAAFAIATLFGIVDAIRHNAVDIIIDNCGIYYAGGEHVFKSTIKCIFAKNNQIDYVDEPHWFGSIVDVYIMAVNLVTQRILRILLTPVAVAIEMRRRKREDGEKNMDDREKRIGFEGEACNLNSKSKIVIEQLKRERDCDLKDRMKAYCEAVIKSNEY